MFFMLSSGIPVCVATCVLRLALKSASEVTMASKSSFRVNCMLRKSVLESIGLLGGSVGGMVVVVDVVLVVDVAMVI